jgi:hypothetical protein
MGAEAHAASSRYAWSAIASEYLEIFEELAAKKLKPPQV